MSPNTALGAGFFLTELQQSRISLVQTNGQNLSKKNTNTRPQRLISTKLEKNDQSPM